MQNESKNWHPVDGNRVLPVIRSPSPASEYAYGYTSIYIDSGNVVRGYHRTELDYSSDLYYTPYVCGELSKDGVQVVRACQGGYHSATRYTSWPNFAGSSFSALSDHYVDMAYQEEDPNNPGYYSFADYFGYGFSGSGGHPIDWYWVATAISNIRPEQSIRLGDTNVVLAQDVNYKKVRFSNVSADFTPLYYSATLNIASATGGASACAGSASNPFTIYVDFDMPTGANSLKHPDSSTFVTDNDNQQFRLVAFGFQDMEFTLLHKGTMWIKLFRIPTKPSNRVDISIAGTSAGETGVWKGLGRVFLECQ